MSVCDWPTRCSFQKYPPALVPNAGEVRVGVEAMQAATQTIGMSATGIRDMDEMVWRKRQSVRAGRRLSKLRVLTREARV